MVGQYINNQHNPVTVCIELDEIISTPCSSHAQIDNTLRNYLKFTTKFKADYLSTNDAVIYCSYKLMQSQLFKLHYEYVRRQLIYVLLQEEDFLTLHITVTFLLLDGRRHEQTFEMMQTEGSFTKLLYLIRATQEVDSTLYRLLLELIYEVSRIQRLSWEDLCAVS